MHMIDSASALQRLHELECLGDKGLNPESKTRRHKEIERCASELPSEVLHRYYILKKRFGKSAVVEMKNRICLGCFISLPLSVEPIDGEIFCCEHCGRLLIDSEAMNISGYSP